VLHGAPTKHRAAFDPRAFWVGDTSHILLASEDLLEPDSSHRHRPDPRGTAHAEESSGNERFSSDQLHAPVNRR